MKKTIKPSPFMVIFTGVLAVIAAVVTVIELISHGSLSAKDIIMDILTVGAFVWQLFEFFSRERVEFDENIFTVGGKGFEFSAISNADAEAVQVTRSFSTLQIEIYVDGEYVFTFRKNDKGAGDFIALMKKHGVSVSIDV